jgi:Ca2+-binding RTX toxin-like protein
VGDYKPEEDVFSTESVVGSNYDDVLRGTNLGTARGLGGNETCTGFLSHDCGGGPAPNVTLDALALDPGLLVQGGPGGDLLVLSVTAEAYVVTSNTPISAGAGCANTSFVVVACPKPATTLGYATVWGAEGPDQISIGEGFPELAVVVLDGGPGSDGITGSSGDDILRAGPSGADGLVGGAGNDALFSGPGSDTLDGGDGSDQLVTTDPCGGHDFQGGPGEGDIAGFAQSTDQGVTATIGGLAAGRSQSPCPPTRVRGDNEVLEGTQHPDILYGDGKANALILGNEGDDILYGYGGADVLRGEAGHDALYGGGGADKLEAFDRRRDVALHCGPGGNKVIRDKVDPPGANCGEPKKKGGKRKRKR